MRERLYIYTKPNIVSVRFNDDEMEFVQGLIADSKLKASDVLRQAFQLLKQRFEHEGGEKYPSVRRTAAESA